MWRKSIHLVHSYIGCIHPKDKLVQEHISLPGLLMVAPELSYKLRTRVLVLLAPSTNVWQEAKRYFGMRRTMLEQAKSLKQILS